MKGQTEDQLMGAVLKSPRLAPVKAKIDDVGVDFPRLRDRVEGRRGRTIREEVAKLRDLLLPLRTGRNSVTRSGLIDETRAASLVNRSGLN